MDKATTIVFPSLRAKKRFLRRRHPIRRFGHKHPTRRSRFKTHPVRSLRLRPLVAPALAEHYAVALLMLRHVEGDADDEKLIATLRDLIPGRFKISYVAGARSWPRYYRVAEMSAINRIYLTHESDLCIVLLAFKARIWRIMRIVAEKSLTHPDAPSPGDHRVHPANPSAADETARLDGAPVG